MRVRVSADRKRPQLKRERCNEASGHVSYRSWCQWCIVARAADKSHLREKQPETDEAVPRIGFDFADLGEEDSSVAKSFPQCS